MAKVGQVLGALFILGGIAGLIYMIVLIAKGGTSNPFTGLGVPSIVALGCGLYLLRDRLGIFQPKDADPTAGSGRQSRR